MNAVPVFATKFVKGWPEHPEGERADYMTIAQAMTKRFSSDAHFTAYSVPSVARRLATDAVFAELESAPLVLLVIDVDAGKSVTPEWWGGEREKIDCLLGDQPDGFVYRTRGGYRIVYSLVTPVHLACTADAERWKAQYTAWLDHIESLYGIVADRACKDWTRLYRLPFVIREGERQELETIGDPNAIGTWSVVVVVPEPEPRRAKSSSGTYTPKPGDFDIDSFMSAHYPGVPSRNVSDGRRWDVECPWVHEHSSNSGKRETMVFANAVHDDRPGFKCQHEHCSNRKWQDFRAWHDPSYTPYDAARSAGFPPGYTVNDVDEKPAKADKKWKIQTATSDWVTKQLPPREHLLFDLRTTRGALDKTGVWIFGGAGGAGKSYLTIGLALAVINGTPWVGTFKPAKVGRVLIIAAEDSVDDIKRRAHAIAAAEHLDPEAMPRLDVLPLHNTLTSLVAISGEVYAPSEDTKTMCAQIASGEPYDVVIVDPYGRIAGVSVDADNAAAAATISALAMIGDAARGLVIGITHTSLRARLGARNGASEGATGIRGATGQTDYARGVLRLEKDDDAIWLSLAKANHVAQWEPVGLSRGDHGELVALSPDDISSIQAARAGAGDAKQAKRTDDRRKRDAADDEAVREATRKNPGASERAVRSIVEGMQGCGKDRAVAAMDRIIAANARGGF